jgi:FixJ family two-component response regulator
MPHMDGEEFAREALRVRHDVPIILVTGFSEKMDAAAATHLGVRKMLSKPYTTQMLAETIREAIVPLSHREA